MSTEDRAPYAYDDGGNLLPLAGCDVDSSRAVLWLTREQADTVLRARRLLFGPAQ